MEDRIAVIIPAYNPSERLVSLVREVKSEMAALVVVVDDGNGPALSPLWRALQDAGCVVLHHGENCGKGAAIKTAVRYLISENSDVTGYVTADADYQHLPRDICAVAQALLKNPHSLVLGVRDFSAESVPFRSRFGNRLSSGIFRFQSGLRLADTQTGLRGVPMQYAHLCARTGGDRFEYEMNMLLAMVKQEVPLVTVPIQTVYGAELPRSNYRTVKDSARIASQLLKYSSSSLLCAGIDVCLFAIVRSLLPGIEIFGATVAARIFSGACNFLINRNMVFKSRGHILSDAVKYASLFLLVMCMSGALTTLLSRTALAEVPAKIIADTALFVLSFLTQKLFVFSGRREVN
ncbi:MAG: bifunctional glycosyltransferase family 2/GtrA family protein [Clostridiales Family XIII bacterium]|jgi:putative flippase GtrA|nr:bifunctional glycosyltransferase family 2/GtrA family protein [Clostridiales Family XIII bacterium]